MEDCYQIKNWKKQCSSIQNDASNAARTEKWYPNNFWNDLVIQTQILDIVHVD